MGKKAVEVSDADKIKAVGKEMIGKAVSGFSGLNIKKKIISVLMGIMILCVINCFLSGVDVMENSKSAIHEIEGLLYYVLAAINCCSAIILGVMLEKE